MTSPSPSVSAERIWLLYRHMPLVLAANLINGSLLVAALWHHAEPTLLILWGSALALLTTIRVGLWAWYRRCRSRGGRVAPWGWFYAAGSAVSGLLWGATAWLFIKSDDPLSLMLIAFVIAGMAAGAVTGLSCHLPSFYLYLLISVLPLAGRLMAEADRVSLAMSGMVVVFAIGLAVIGRSFNLALTRLLQLTEDRQRLLADTERLVRERTSDLRAANAELVSEAAERRRAQDEERRLSAEVARQAYQLNGILATITDHVFMLSGSGRLLYASPSALHDFGIDADAVAGKSWTDLGLAGEEASVLEAMHRRVMSSRASVTAEATHRTPGGLRRYEYKFNPMSELDDRTGLMSERDDRIGAVIAVSRDITERMRAERALEQARTEAERANRAKSRFLAAASHDLRQPLQSMFLVATALHRYVGEDEGLAELVMLERGLDTLKGLLDSLLDVSRLDVTILQPRLESFPLQALLEEIGASYAPIAASKGLELRVGASCGGHVHSDRNLLGRMVRNLVENAVRYTERGQVLLESRVDGETVGIEVRDTGIGIPPDQLAWIFEEFHQIGNPERDKANGLGLGLAIVQRLSVMLGHAVGVRSKLGRGSTFSITVPLDAVAVASPVPAENDVTIRPSPGKLVVLVDDDALVLFGLRAAFQDWGYETVIAGSADEALKRLAVTKRSPDLVVADYRLHGGQIGTEAILKVRALFHAAIPGIILTGESGTECARDVEEHGLDLIHKPITPRELQAALRRLVG